jgi:hypothetical protein
MSINALKNSSAAGMRQELRRRAGHLTEVIGKRGSVFGGGSRETREVGATPKMRARSRNAMEGAAHNKNQEG